MSNTVQPCKFNDIAYLAFSRVTGAEGGVYVLASANTTNAVSQMFFQVNNGQLTLMQSVPQGVDGLVSWYQATTIVQGESSIAVTDGFGTHQVPVVPWNGTAVSGSGGRLQPGTSPCTGNNLGYLAFNREDVLFLQAGCSYPVGAITIAFTPPDTNPNWTLQQTVPTGTPQIVTQVVAGATTGAALVDPPASVTVVDGFGSHSLDVVTWPVPVTAGR